MIQNLKKEKGKMSSTLGNKLFKSVIFIMEFITRSFKF